MNKKQINRMSIDELRFALAMGLKAELYKHALKRYVKLKAQKREAQSQLEALKRSTRTLVEKTGKEPEKHPIGRFRNVAE